MCNFRIGDAVSQMVLYVTVMAYFGYEAATVSPYYGIFSGVILAGMTIGSLLNKKSRADEALRLHREAQQRLLGVPPEERVG